MTDPAPKPTQSLHGLIATFAIAFLVALMLMHAFMTGSPIPLWQVDKLNAPTAVTKVDANYLVLEDGRELRLRFMSSLPKDSSLFLAALRDGVEIDEKGEAFGRIWSTYCQCRVGEPYYWTKRRVNLSDLAAAIKPEGIDTSLVAADILDDIEACRIVPTNSNATRLTQQTGRQLRETEHYFRLVRPPSY